MITPSNGYLDGSGVSPFGAHKDHTHADLLKASKVTIAVADWEGESASVDLPEGLTTYVSYVVDNGSASAASEAELVLSAVGDESLTFGATTTPTDPIDIYVMYL